MHFHSILSPSPEFHIGRDPRPAPDFFHDLNLDQIVETITAGRQEYDLIPFFHARLTDLDAVAYRQEVMRDLEMPAPMQVVATFSQQMRKMREHIAQSKKLYYRYEKERWFLSAVELYCAAVEALSEGLGKLDLKSRGLLALRHYLAEYAGSPSFEELATTMRKLGADLSAIKYTMLIRNSRVTVRAYDSESDYSASVEHTFEKFKRGAVKDYRVKFPGWPGLNHIEAQILDFVAKLNEATFLALDRYCADHAAYLDARIANFDREVQFYVACLSYVSEFQKTGLSFCYPRLSASKEVRSTASFDAALAHKLIRENSAVVCNDFFLHERERIFVVSGPNQGGKTTFARTFGQLHYMASLGCQVPGTHADLFFFDALFAHFEREENIQNLHGKLQDDLVRIHRILDKATSSSIVIMNEIFSSTTLKDALQLSRKVFARLSALDLLCVCVTFIDELSVFDEKTVSVVSSVDADDPTRRTYRLGRRRADGLSYAMALAEKYHLTHKDLMERITS